MDGYTVVGHTLACFLHIATIMPTSDVCGMARYLHMRMRSIVEPRASAKVEPSTYHSGT